MGGILSNEEKAARARAARRKHRGDIASDVTLGVPWDAHGYRYREQRVRGHRSHKRVSRKSVELAEDRPSRGEKSTRARSQSLDAILEELYLSDTENDAKRPFIPRAKLNSTLTRGRGGEDKLLNGISYSRFESDSASLHAIHMQVERKALERNRHLRPSLSLPFLEASEWEGDMETDHDHLSMGPPSYSQDFDACMRQLEDMERSKEVFDVHKSALPTIRIQVHEEPLEIEEESVSSVSVSKSRIVKRQQTPTKESAVLPPVDDSSDQSDQESPTEPEDTADEAEEAQEHVKTAYGPTQAANLPTETAIRSGEKVHQAFPQRNSDKIVIVESQQRVAADAETARKPRGWYCNLKEQFERLDKEMGRAGSGGGGGGRHGGDDVSCRITGATLKNNKNTATDDDASTNRKHYFSQLVRSNKSLIDEELPDPDKVQNIRAMFQEHHNRLGGSLQNISTSRLEAKPERPKSALGSRKEDELRCLTPDSVDGDGGLSQNHQTRHAGLPRDLAGGRHRLGHHPYLQQRRWTDTGSMSSGVSSDLSSCETDQESYTRDHLDNSDDDEIDVLNRHYIQSEILEKIRSFGTSVTYFGGEMIRCSVGPLVSPTTHAILEEIGQKQPNGLPGTRSFDEFYKKYKESKKRKVGRTRSFAQEEMFQKSSVFTDSEIEEHKTELETAFGIRRPKGNQPTGMKGKLGKSFSLDSRIQGFEKALALQESVFANSRGDTIPRAKIFSEQKTETGIKRSQTNNHLFEFKERIQQTKHNDMEFEEFQVLENICDRVERKTDSIKKDEEPIGSRDKDQRKGSDTSEFIVKAAFTNFPHEMENELNGIENHGDMENIEKENDIIPNQKKEEVESFKRNSIQEKLTSWEEAIQQKRLRSENRLNERKDGAPVLVKRNSTDLTETPRRGSTDELINNFEEHIRQRNSNNQNGCEVADANEIPVASDCSSESTHSIDYENTEKIPTTVTESVITEAGNTDTWGRQAQLRRKSLDNENRRNSCENLIENSGEFNGSGTWKRFVAARRYSSTESLSQNRRFSQESQNGSRRNSVKKLVPLDATSGRELCQETRKHSLDLKGLNSNDEIICLAVADNEKRSSAGGNGNGSRKNSGASSQKSSTEKRENNTKGNEDSVNGCKNGSRRASKEDKHVRGTNVNKENISNQANQQVDAESNICKDKKESSGDRQENNKSEQSEYKITIKISQTETESYKIGNEEFEEIVLLDQDPVDSLELYFSKTDDKSKSNKTSGQESTTNTINDSQVSPVEGNTGTEDVITEYKRRFDKNKSYKGPSRWPVETTVVVDMEKSDEMIPKLISTGKTPVKSKKRIF